MDVVQRTDDEGNRSWDVMAASGERVASIANANSEWRVWLRGHIHEKTLHLSDARHNTLEGAIAWVERNV